MVTWIKGGDVVDPVKGVVEKTDVIIEKGKVAKILPPGVFKDKIPKMRTINAFNKLVNLMGAHEVKGNIISFSLVSFDQLLERCRVSVFKSLNELPITIYHASSFQSERRFKE